ncbi:hypothetical protein J6590_056730 [Homalodisca vitripennis]|nr:hypothetical protein J6590_056730 [Homalodisca vitripennis]
MNLGTTQTSKKHGYEKVNYKRERMRLTCGQSSPNGSACLSLSGRGPNHYRHRAARSRSVLTSDKSRLSSLCQMTSEHNLPPPTPPPPPPGRLALVVSDNL